MIACGVRAVIADHELTKQVRHSSVCPKAAAKRRGGRAGHTSPGPKRSRLYHENMGTTATAPTHAGRVSTPSMASQISRMAKNLATESSGSCPVGKAQRLLRTKTLQGLQSKWSATTGGEQVSQEAVVAHGWSRARDSRDSRRRGRTGPLAAAAPAPASRARCRRHQRR